VSVSSEYSKWNVDAGDVDTDFCGSTRDTKFAALDGPYSSQIASDNPYTFPPLDWSKKQAQSSHTSKRDESDMQYQSVLMTLSGHERVEIDNHDYEVTKAFF